MTRSVWKGPFVDGYLLKKAEAAINGLGTSAKLSAQAKLVDPKVQITRAGAYIDAITSGKKILDKNQNL